MIPIYNQITGNVFIADFDLGVLKTLGGFRNLTDVNDPGYVIAVQFNNKTINVPVYFSQPEPIFKLMRFPFVTINRDDITLAMHRWMGVGQLEYRTGVSGTVSGGFSQYQMKPQAFPHDIVYTISCWDRYESPVQTTLFNLLKSVYPMGRLIVNDSLNQVRSYEYYWEGAIANLQEIIDPVTRARGYAITIRVEAELDLADAYVSDSVSGIVLNIDRF